MDTIIFTDTLLIHNEYDNNRAQAHQWHQHSVKQ